MHLVGSKGGSGLPSRGPVAVRGEVASVGGCRQRIRQQSVRDGRCDVFFSFGGVRGVFQGCFSGVL